MPERDAQQPNSGPPATPRVSGEHGVLHTPIPSSSTRLAQDAAQSGAASAPSDTLLSAGPPAHRLELLLEDRMAAVDLRLQALEARVSGLERKRPLTREPALRSRPWLWLVFLVAVAAVFQLLRLAK